MSNVIRPGDLLAGRYRLVDLLSESGTGRFWRAHDRVLARHVAVHVIAADDKRAAGLKDAARRSAAVPDRRLLRVLDVDEWEGLCYVVNEWGSGTSLDVMLANDGPLNARRAAWIVSEVAAVTAAAHAVGASHGHLVPESVMVDHAGMVRVIGFAVDAALLGLPPERRDSDVVDLASLLYAALTGRWSGASQSEVPPAPQEGGRLLRPRQVAAGVPRPLDTLCDTVLNRASDQVNHVRGRHDLETAAGISAALREFVGDPHGMAAQEAARDNGAPPTVERLPPEQPAPPGGREAAPPTAEALPSPPDERPEPTPADSPTVAVELQPESEPTVVTPVTETPAPPSSGDQPTQAGFPVFDDEHDDVSWLTARAEKPPPPPPFEEAPARPLFAPEPPQGEPARRPRPGASAPRTSGEFWPWDTGTGTGTGTGAIHVPEEPEEPEEMPGRSWLRLAAGIGVAGLLFLAIVAAFNLGQGDTPLGIGGEDSPDESASPSRLSILKNVTARDFDPQGDPPEENSELAPLAVDGDRDTSWETSTYDQNLGPGGLKTGVGLVLDLGRSRDVGAVAVTVAGGPTGISVFVTETDPTDVPDSDPVASDTTDSTWRARLEEPATGRFVTVWLTSLPDIGGFRGSISEVVVRG